VNLLCLEAEKAPLCLIVEDIQWVDPSTKELLHRLIARAARLPLLVVITERVGSKLTRNHGFDAAEIALKGLSSAATQKMIRGAGGDASLPGEVVRLLVEKADGVPLFIEESTRMLVEHRAAGGPASARSFTVPATIKDLLMTRLDQLSAAKQVAQLGGAIGREFPLALMQAVVAHESSPINTDDLASHLDTLVNSGLLIEKGEAPDTRYVFKHALVRDAAYESLLVSIRKSLHRTIALVIGEKFDDLAISQPELLAYHYTEAGMDPEALEYWEKAARLATSRSAHNEAISHLSSGLSVLSRLPEGSQRNCAELRLQLSLAGQLIATEGYGADRVERVYARASEVCRMVGDDAAMMKIQFGLEGYHFMRADFQKAHAIAVQAATMLRSPDPLRQLQARWAVANILFHQGELLSAVARMERCIEEYGNMKRRPTAVQDPGVMCLCYSAWGKWQLGYPEQALALASKAVALSEEMNHRFSMGEAFGFRTSVHHFRGESDEALACAERAIEICEDGGFAVWLAHAKLMRGRIVAERGDTAAGIEEMRRAYDMWTATGAVVTTPFYLALQAEGFALAGRPDDGLVLLQRAYDIVRKHGERYYEAEIMRLFGELTLQSAALRGIEASAEAERWFLGALESAQLRQLRSMMLRSATSLSRLRRTQGRAAEAYWVLASAFEWFQEGADTRDVRSARALLGELALTRASA
jgi:tetratricopeptide (TPR) repeat protein